MVGWQLPKGNRQKIVASKTQTSLNLAQNIKSLIEGMWKSKWKATLYTITINFGLIKAINPLQPSGSSIITLGRSHVCDFEIKKSCFLK